MATQIVRNLLCDIYHAGGPFPPAPAAQLNVPCQLYVHSRADIDQIVGVLTPDNWFPPVYLRLLIADYNVLLNLVQVPSGSGLFYRPKWSHPVHLGFANEYMQVLLAMVHVPLIPGTTNDVVLYGENVQS
jgi:hypothetical protein